ncbi:hypothetical protein PHMEG_0009753 [Phytophthora megakarya]|uniref:Uncharacterized protein n=1 Tax=Phytophthora megakarya TaxID=4795 RepID=A0A225WFQ3_9STRA|nr:hypothetical protein PHMEG_0009753 [Phytophthora megakarya]
MFGKAVTQPAERQEGEKDKKSSAQAGKKDSVVLDWSESIVRDLMTLLFDTYAEHLNKTKNNLKSLKRKWAEYNWGGLGIVSIK